MDIRSVEVLLVEDNPHDAELTLRGLKTKNLANNVHVVRDGVEALEFIFNKGEYSHRKDEIRPKLVLLDLKLPRVDGMEVLQKIKSHDETKNMPVVVLTSSNQDRDIEKCYKLGVNSYIVKPVDFNKFVDAVSKLGLYWLVINQPPS